MKLNYYTLWIENDPEWLDSTIENMTGIVEEQGFVLKADRCLSAEEFYEKSKQDPSYLDKYDLILTDYNLGAGDTGNVLIEKIREDNKNPYTDIIFYGQDQQAIAQKLNDHFIEGVYKSPRDIGLFGEKFEKVFTSTIKKVQDISMMRGLVISEVSEMSIRIMRLIQKYIEISEDNAINLQKYIFKDVIDKHISDNAKIKEKLEQLEIATLIEDRFFDDNKKSRILNKICNSMVSYKFHADYEMEILNVRNELGHCEEIIKNGQKVLMTHKGDKEFTDEACVGIRKTIIKHQQRLDEIENYIKKLKLA